MQTLTGSGVHFGDLQFCLLTIAIRTMILVKARNNLNLVRIVTHGHEDIKTKLNFAIAIIAFFCHRELLKDTILKLRAI